MESSADEREAMEWRTSVIDRPHVPVEAGEHHIKLAVAVDVADRRGGEHAFAPTVGHAGVVPNAAVVDAERSPPFDGTAHAIECDHATVLVGDPCRAHPDNDLRSAVLVEVQQRQGWSRLRWQSSARCSRY